MDLIVILILIIAVAIIYKKFRNVVYFIGIMEIFFRLIHAIVANLKIQEVTRFVNNYIPSSLAGVLHKYSSGLLYDVFIWILIAIFCVFEYFLIKSFIKKK